jgi:NAD(P)-dependent dehydrogenase (short-subunit alcohol dehydrogenase family)
LFPRADVENVFGEFACGLGCEARQPIRRAGISEYVAPAALWLASDASSFVTGQDLAVDGGISAGRPAAVAKAERATLGKAFAAIVA